MQRYRVYITLFLIFISPLYAQGDILKIAVSFYDPPFVVQGTGGQLYGFDVAMMEHICRTIERKCQFIPIPANKLVDAVETKTVDIAVGSLIITGHDANIVNFSLPYLVSQIRFLGLKNQEDKPFDLQLLNNKKIGIVEDDFADQIKMMGIKNSEIVLFAQDDAMIHALNQGKIQFALLDNFTAIYWHLQSSGVLVALGKPITFGFGIAIAIDQNNIPLLQEINIALLKYQNSDQFIKDYDKYLSQF